MEGYGRGNRQSGWFGMQTRTMLLVGAMIASTLLVIEWEAPPWSSFFSDSRVHSFRVRIGGSFSNIGERSTANFLNSESSHPKDKLRVARPRQNSFPDHLSVRSEEWRASRASHFREDTENKVPNETEQMEENSTGAAKGTKMGRSPSSLEPKVDVALGTRETDTQNRGGKNEVDEIPAQKSELELDEVSRSAKDLETRVNLTLREKNLEVSQDAMDTGNNEATRDQLSSGEIMQEVTGSAKAESKMENEKFEDAKFPDVDSDMKCDYSIGHWVPDNRLLYSGNECKMWLDSSFSCRLNKRPDMSYENFHWQPLSCDLPKFDGRLFLNRFLNKVLAFIGDSLGRQQFLSLMCMVTRGKNDTLIHEVGSEFGFYTPHGARRPTGYAYRFYETNTTIVFVWTVTLARVEALNNSNQSFKNALHLDRPIQFLCDRIHQLDVVILNSGHHWNRGKMQENGYVFYKDGLPVGGKDPLYMIAPAYNYTIHAVVKWVSKQIEHTEKQVCYRSLSPRHFRNGEWNTGGTCDTSRFDNDVVVQEGDPIDSLAESATRGTNVKLLNITSLSLSRAEAHISKYTGRSGGQDCLHWCMPGIPDSWNEILFAMLSPPIFRKRPLEASLESYLP